MASAPLVPAAAAAQVVVEAGPDAAEGEGRRGRSVRGRRIVDVVGEGEGADEGGRRGSVSEDDLPGAGCAPRSDQPFGRGQGRRVGARRLAAVEYPGDGVSVSADQAAQVAERGREGPPEDVGPGGVEAAADRIDVGRRDAGRVGGLGSKPDGGPAVRAPEGEAEGTEGSTVR